LRRAKFRNGAVQHIDLIEEIDRCTPVGYLIKVRTVDGQPFVEIFALGQCDGQTEVAGAQRCFGVLLQLILLGALINVLFRLERLVLVTVKNQSLGV
jgi:hypothetical protein